MFCHVTEKRYLFDMSKKKFGDTVAYYREMCCTKVLYGFPCKKIGVKVNHDKKTKSTGQDK